MKLLLEKLLDIVLEFDILYMYKKAYL